MNDYTSSEAARTASDYFNALPIEQRRQLAPLLDHYRQMGVAEALDQLAAIKRRLSARVSQIRQNGTVTDPLAARGDAEALAEALERIKRATAIEDSGDVDPMTQYRQVERAKAIATGALDDYRAAYPQEEST